MDRKRIVIPGLDEYSAANLAQDIATEHGLEVEIENEDECRIEVVDGEPVRVHASSGWDDEDRAAFAEIVRAAKEHFRKSVDSGTEAK